MEFNIFDYQFSKEQDLLLYYKGEFDDSTLLEITSFLKEQFRDLPRVSKKVFAVSVELVQNIAYYSAETNQFGTHKSKYGVGIMLVADLPDEVVLTSGNLIPKSDLQEIIKRCDQINKLQQDELRLLKKDIRNQPRREGHKGGNIGLVQVAIKSENPLKVEHKDVDNNMAFFTLSTHISKNQQGDE